MTPEWADLRGALDDLAADGCQAQFWLRDDDATSDTAALRQLANWARRHDADVLLALVPSVADATLGSLLVSTPQFVGAVHGWSHTNHAPPSEKKQELGAHRPIDAVCRELTEALSRAQSLGGTRVLPVLVPPWNRISSEIVEVLPQLGYRGLSTVSSAHTGEPVGELVVENSHVDIIDWRGTRGGRRTGDLIEDLISAISARAKANQPIGILSHHLVHDTAAWAFLDDFGGLVSQHPGAAWISPNQLFPA